MKNKKKTVSREKNKLKKEIIKELGLENEIAEKGLSGLSSRQTGMIGARMAKKLKK